MTRIRLDMSFRDIVVELVEGNPGALSVCVQLMERTAEIDPDAMMGGLGALLSLDQHGIYGSRIWCLYKYVCGEDVTKTLACMRAVQLGLLRESVLQHAIDNRGDGLDVDDALAAVRKRLPRFAPTPTLSSPSVATAPAGSPACPPTVATLGALGGEGGGK